MIIGSRDLKSDKVMEIAPSMRDHNQEPQCNKQTPSTA